MSLRDRLEAKARRHHDHRVVITDPLVAASQVEVASTELLAAQRPGGDPDVLAVAQEALTAAQVAFAACFEVVGFDAMDPDAYEDLVVEHLDPETGTIVEATCLPALAAACAVEEDLRDPAWWTARLASGVWTSGERDDLYHGLYLLHRSIPSEALGKG